MPLDLSQIDAVVLAGGVNTIPLYAGYTPGYKALLPLAGKPNIQYVLDALQAVPQVKRICIVGPEAELRQAIEPRDGQHYDFVPSGDTLLASIFNGLGHFADSPMVLTLTADLPLITPAAITDFLTACAKAEPTYQENMFLSLVPQQSFTGPYAHCPKGFNRFRDLTVCHGNLMLIDPRLLNNSAATRRMDSLYNARKSPVNSALTIGFHVGLSYVLGVHLWHLLTVEQMARIASRRFRLGLIPILLDHPEVTIDVDEAEDYAFVLEQLTPTPPAE